jgi:hypothetical protein
MSKSFFCCRRHEIALKWYQAVSIAEEVQILRERHEITLWYVACLVEYVFVEI